MSTATPGGAVDQPEGNVRMAYDVVADAYADHFRTTGPEAPLDHATIAHLASLLAASKRVLDAGCGPGRMMPVLASLGCSVEGVDLSEGMIRRARADHPGFPSQVASLTALPFEDETFDGAFSWYSTIHTPDADLDRVVGELRRTHRLRRQDTRGRHPSDCEWRLDDAPSHHPPTRGEPSSVVDMRYAIRVDVAVPRDVLVTLVDDPMALPHWHEDLLRVEPLEGEPGLDGARTRLVYGVEGCELEIIESVIDNNLPESLTTMAVTCGTCSEFRHEFEQLGSQATRWTQHANYALTGPGVATFGALMPGALPRRTRRQMRALKVFAEATIGAGHVPSTLLPPI